MFLCYNIDMNFLDSVKKIFTHHNAYIGIDIGSTSIKIVEIEERGGILHLASYGEIGLGLYKERGVFGEIVLLEDDVLKKALADILRETHIATKTAGISISATSSLIINFSVPDTDPKTLDSIVMTEIRKYVPIPLTELSIDWWPLPLPSAIEEKQKGNTPVMVAALRKEKMNRYLELVSELKFESSFYEIEVFSSARAIYEHDLSSIAVIDFGASAIRVSILQYGVIRKYSQIKKGSYYLSDQLSKTFEIPFTEAEKFKKENGLLDNPDQKDMAKFLNNQVDLLIEELITILQSYEKESQSAVTRVFMCGGGSKLRGLDDRIKKRFSGDVIIPNPFLKLETPVFLKKVLTTHGPEFSNAIGLALRELQK